MKVHELIEILETLDPDAEVLLATQRDYPFENTLEGVVTRRDFTGLDVEEDDDFVEGPLDSGRRPEPRRSDVLLLEGEQLRCGTAAAWNMPRS